MSLDKGYTMSRCSHHGKLWKIFNALTFWFGSAWLISWCEFILLVQTYPTLMPRCRGHLHLNTWTFSIKGPSPLLFFPLYRKNGNCKLYFMDTLNVVNMSIIISSFYSFTFLKKHQTFAQKVQSNDLSLFFANKIRWIIILTFFRIRNIWNNFHLILFCNFQKFKKF